jgi:hypothetical protein
MRSSARFGDARRLAEPGRGGDDKDLAREDPLPHLRPVVARPLVRADARLYGEVDEPDLLRLDSLGLERIGHHGHERLGVETAGDGFSVQLRTSAFTRGQLPDASSENHGRPLSPGSRAAWR